MAFPQVVATNNSVEAADRTEHIVALPVNIQASETLLVFFVTDGNNATTFPGGWTKIFEEDAGTDAHLAIAWRKADGGEGASIEVATAGVEQSAHISYRISGATDPTVTAPEVSTGATARSNTPNPDSLSAGGGSKEYLWIAVAGSDDGRQEYTGYPADYGNGEGYQSAESTDGCNIGIARRELETDSEDPGTFTIEGLGKDWVACTVAVYPVAPVNYDRSASVIIGTVASASRVYGAVKSASLVIGTIITSGTDWAGTVTVYVGVQTTASRVTAYARGAVTVIGNLVSASRVTDIVRASATAIGIVASASRALALTRSAITGIGLAVKATRVLGLTRTAAIAIGNLVSASRSWGRTRTASVAIGIVVRFSIWVKLLRRLASFTGRSLSAITKRSLSVFTGRDLSSTTNRDLSDEDGFRDLK